jgi:hypothetical protein
MTRQQKKQKRMQQQQGVYHQRALQLPSPLLLVPLVPSLPQVQVQLLPLVSLLLLSCCRPLLLAPWVAFCCCCCYCQS